MLTYQIVESDLKKRVDRYLVEKEPLLSRGLIKKLCMDDKVKFNQKIFRPGDKFRSIGSLEVDYDMTELRNVPVIELPIIYEDDNVLVIDKPEGVITHNRGRYWNEPSVASFLRSHTPQVIDPTDKQSIRAGIVHRLDRATSGVIVCAKNLDTLNFLQKQFSDHHVEKTYLAVISGKIDPTEAIINRPIARNPNTPQKFMVDKVGKEAITKYQLLKYNQDRSLLKLQPKTGRTHQLRVHLSSIGKPIIGDKLYQGLDYHRLMLHAHKITITIPYKGLMEFESIIPEEFLI